MRSVGGKQPMSKYVLDASAVLALLNQEPGKDQVAALLPQSLVGAVNAAEVLSKLVDAGMPIDTAAESLDLLRLEIIDFTRALAVRAASLRQATRKRGLSLGDRCCLALGIESGSEVVTAEKDWDKLKLCPVTTIR